MGSRIELELSGIPPSLNRFAGRKNNFAYRAEKRKWTDLVIWKIKEKKCAPPQPFTYAAVTIIYRFPTRGRRDSDNFSGKLFLDGLTRGGIIKDDDMSHITTTIKGEYSPGNPHTRIVVEEAVR